VINSVYSESVLIHIMYRKGSLNYVISFLILLKLTSVLPRTLVSLPRYNLEPIYHVDHQTTDLQLTLVYFFSLCSIEKLFCSIMRMMWLDLALLAMANTSCHALRRMI
jgi:hypothetical protein